MIYTFYSYKGGVGRTMALANVAKLFYREGLKVLMIDWDLEAPGLEQFFFSQEELESIREQRGVVDLLLGYKAQMTHKLDLSDENNLPFEKPDEIALEIPPKSRKETLPGSTRGKLWLITAGRRSQENPADYAKTVMTFDWRDFYENWLGEAYIDWFRRECEKMADVILIDSRTGVTEIGGVCTYHLADVVVVFCAANNQNLRGTLEMVQNFSQPKLMEVRAGRPLKTLVVPSRIEKLTETTKVNQFYRKLTEYLAHLPDEFKQDPNLLRELEIPYVSLYTFEEIIAVNQAEGSDLYVPDLIEAYTQLTRVLARLAQELKSGLERKIDELTTQLGSHGQKVAKLTRTRILSTHNEEKLRVTKEIEQIEQERSEIEAELERLAQEFQQYSDIPTIM